MNRALHVDTKAFESEVLGSPAPVLVSWHALQSDPMSRMVSPLLDELAERFSGQVKYVKVNAESESDLAYRWGVRRVPSLGFFSGGRMVGPATPVGALEYLVAKLEQLATTPLDQLPPPVTEPALPPAQES